MELNSRTIGSYHTFNGNLRKAKFWKVADVLFAIWTVALVLAIPYIAGFISGVTTVEHVDNWAGQVTAQ